jgi:hypothetical protein
MELFGKKSHSIVNVVFFVSPLEVCTLWLLENSSLKVQALFHAMHSNISPLNKVGNGSCTHASLSTLKPTLYLPPRGFFVFVLDENKTNLL